VLGLGKVAYVRSVSRRDIWISSPGFGVGRVEAFNFPLFDFELDCRG